VHKKEPTKLRDLEKIRAMNLLYLNHIKKIKNEYGTINTPHSGAYMLYVSNLFHMYALLQPYKNLVKMAASNILKS
jgi:hypothetical protein